MGAPPLPSDLRKQLTSRQVPKLAAGLRTLLTSQHASAWITALLEGVRAETSWRFTPGVQFEGTSIDRPYGTPYHELITVLTLYAPPGCAAADALGAGIEHVSVGPLLPGPLDGAQLGRATTAYALRAEGARLLDPSVLAAMPALRSLSLVGCDVPDGLPGLGAAAGLTSIMLQDCPGITRLDGLEGLDVLGALVLHAAALTSLESLPPSLPALQRVQFNRCAALTALDGLERYPTVQAFTAIQCAIESLAPMAGLTGLNHLQLHGMTALTGLEGLPDAPGLSWMSLQECPALTALDGLRPAPELNLLEVTGAAALEQIAGIERLPGLTRLSLRGVRQPLDLTPLRDLPALEVLDLRDSPGITAVGALDDRANIKVILLNASGVARRSVPTAVRWRCSWASSPKVEELKKKTPPAPTRSTMSAGEKVSLARLRKMLKTGDLEVIDQALELIRILDDPAYADALLGGATYEHNRRWGYDDGCDMFLRTRKFSGLTAPYVLFGLLSAASAESAVAAALKEQIQALGFNERGNRFHDPHPFDPLHLEALPNLKKLGFYHFGPFRQRDRAPSLPGLETFVLRYPKGPISLEWLSGCAALRTLVIEGVQNNQWDDALGWRPEGLTEIELKYCYTLADLSELSGLRHLKTLRVDGCYALRQIGALTDLPALETLHLSHLTDLPSLEGLGPMPRLKRVELDCVDYLDLSALDAAPALESVRLGHRAHTDVEALAARGVRVGRDD